MHDVIVLLVAVAASLYAVGALNLWRRAGLGHGVSRWRVLSFAVACATVLLALGAPFDEIADTSFAAHMVQHEALMIVAAPLFVAARPLPTWLWALPSSLRISIAESRTVRLSASIWRSLKQPIVATFAQLIALWIWHVPRFFDAALRDPSLHVAQHGSFFIAALAFWTALMSPHRRRDDVAHVALLFVTMLGTGALGALLAFAPTPWYARYAYQLSDRLLTPLEDQQLGGLVMWIPAGIPYMAAALWILGRSLRSTRSGPSFASSR